MKHKVTFRLQAFTNENVSLWVVGDMVFNGDYH